jgi:hypothetical protein
MYYTTSVKLTCCEPDVNAYDTNADGTPASDEDKAMQRMCPPPENDAQGQIRWGDSDEYITDADGVLGQTTPIAATATSPAQVCFHNRTLASPVHLASIQDYTADFADVYGGINNATTLVEYVEDPQSIWDQDKSATSFYQVRAAPLLRVSLCAPLLTAPILCPQLCVAERAKKKACCEGTSNSPCQPDMYPTTSTGTACAYPTTLDDMHSECANVDDVYNWVPAIDPTCNREDYYFFAKVIINVVHRPPSPPPSPPPPSPPPPSPPPSPPPPSPPPPSPPPSPPPPSPPPSPPPPSPPPSPPPPSPPPSPPPPSPPPPSPPPSPPPPSPPPPSPPPSPPPPSPPPSPPPPSPPNVTQPFSKNVTHSGWGFELTIFEDTLSRIFFEEGYQIEEGDLVVFVPK